MFYIHILGYSTQFSVICYRVEIYEREKNSNFLQVFSTLKSKELALTSIKNKTKVLFQNNHTEIPYIKRNVCAWLCSMSKV